MTATPARTVPFFNYPQLFLADEQVLVDIFRDVGHRVDRRRRHGQHAQARWFLGLDNKRFGRVVSYNRLGLTNNGGESFAARDLVSV